MLCKVSPFSSTSGMYFDSFLALKSSGSHRKPDVKIFHILAYFTSWGIGSSHVGPYLETKVVGTVVTLSSSRNIVTLSALCKRTLSSRSLTYLDLSTFKKRLEIFHRFIAVKRQYQFSLLLFCGFTDSST